MSYQPATTADGSPRSEGAERVRLIRILHREGSLRRLSHDDLRGGAQLAFGVQSLADLTPSQLRQCIQSLCVKMPVARPEPAASPRERKGSTSGCLRMLTDPQRELIYRIAGEIGWDQAALDAAIRRHLDIDGMGAVRTTVQGKDVINFLIGTRRSHQRTWRGPRTHRESQPQHQAREPMAAAVQPSADDSKEVP